VVAQAKKQKRRTRHRNERTTRMPTPTADTQPSPPPIEHRVEALELFMRHLVLMLETEPRFTAAAMSPWLDAARQRMKETGSVTPGALAALARLQQKALG
jgi:hypothetical protein